MIEAGDLRNGTVFERDGQLFVTVSYSHMKMGRGTAQVRAKIRNLKTGSTMDETFRPEQRFPLVRIERRKMQYLYADGGQYHFMDSETFDQVALDEAQLGEALKFLRENTEIIVQTYDGTAIGVELPTTVDLVIIETDPGFKGDTAVGGTKPAKVETGLMVAVPLFVAQGERIKVDTRTGEYVERA
ncbi:MAG: elongation factor P [Candidatus Dormibacteria bacterium]